MSLELTKADLLQAAEAAFVRFFSAPEFREEMAAAVADKIALRFELLNREEAAALIGKSESTLQRYHTEWGLTKSVEFGRESPLFFLSEIVARAKATVIQGRAENVVPLPVASAKRKAG